VALIVSVAAYAYSLSGIVTAGDDLRETPNRVWPEHRAPAAHEGCRDVRDDSVRL
jgi:hypothetical protein